ncbi:hypothetical protein HYE82_21770 [Streptomyces sp. BR123]|uniref:hypothetical protein n=1 Tax=Streptomyces sp. BR123 TaxID=2749828 RepID=UPI0015C485AF|nr:hypothetical protein [Streptomyces sp. BR123]NXY96962.1 hypothetical protein [Streptomyces sp. BR123]
MMDDHTRPDGAGDEQELRTLLHAAVSGLEPSAGALDRLRSAVPARRARKRRAIVGAAAAALLAGTALPTALHLGIAGGEGSVSDHSAMAGHGEEAATGAGAGGHGHDHSGAGHPPKQPKGAGAGPGGHGGTTAGSDPTAAGSPSGGGTADPSAGGTGGATGSSGGPMPPVASPAAPGCSADQLGVQANARAPEADGKVYGSFTVTNVSARGCSVVGPDTVTAASVSSSASGGAGGVTVVGHTAGDAAPGLPDPSAEAPSLVLQPYAAYEVRFAWVPSGMSCPAASADPGTKPPAGSTPQEQLPADGTAAAEPAAGGAAEPAAATTGVAVSHTPATAVPGAPAPTTRATIPAACGGTLYRTGVIPVDAAQKP